MNYQRFIKYVFALALAVGFVVAPGLSSLSAVQAQNWPYNQDRSERERERQRREEWRRRQRDNRQSGDWDWNRRNDRNGDWNRRNDRDGDWNRRNDRGGYYGDNRGYDNGQVQKGYRDGLDRGQKDAKTNRVPTPSNSQHYREGNPSYREGFARGYQVGYRQYARGGYNGW